MDVLRLPWGALHYADEGPKEAPALIFANSLGTDLRLWAALLPHLPKGLRLIRFDKRGHGLSDLPTKVSIDDFADDAIAVAAHLRVTSAVFVGLSIGGQIAQALAAKHPAWLKGIVISNSGAKIGNAETWDARIAAVSQNGLESIADAIMERWFAPAFRATPAVALWRNMVVRTPAAGYVAACHALKAADYTASTAALKLPALLIAGEHDGSTPPDLVKATADLIAGARFTVIPGTGHLPCVEAPAAYAAALNGFLKEIKHG